MNRLLLALAAFFLPGLAHAGFVDFCIQYNVDFTDASTSVGDDYLLSNGPKRARGAKVKITDTTTSTIQFEGNLEQSGADRGCAMDVFVVSSNAHSVRLYSEAALGTNTVEVRNNDVSDTQYTYTWTPSLVGLSAKTLTTSAAEQWNIMAATGLALNRHDGGLSLQSFIFYTEDCPTTGAPACVRKDTDDNFSGYFCLEADCTEAPAKSKYAIVHQQGHLVMIKANGGAREIASSAGVAIGDCTGGAGHNVNHSEFQSRAATEGIADLWAAIAFNKVESGADCGFKSVQVVDWDNDDDGDDQIFDCDGTLFTSGSTTIDGDDYMGDECADEEHYGTQVDWLRMWWDLMTDESLDDDDVFAIWDAANPHTWETEDTPAGPAYKPAKRLESAAATVVPSADWTGVAATNGTDR